MGDTTLTTKDVVRLSWGIATMRKIFQTVPLQSYWEGELLPGEATDLNTWVRITIINFIFFNISCNSICNNN